MSVSTAIDTALDRSIALGYGNVGLKVRRRLPGWPADPPAMDGKVVLVTGAGSGLGQASAIGFARLGATVHVLGRNPERAGDAARAVTAAVGGAEVHPVACDVSEPTAVRELCERLDSELERLDVLVNNAGVMPDERTRNSGGLELTFATQVLAPWMLTDGLSDLLRRSAPARVINVTSGGQYAQGIPAGDLESEDSKYSPKGFYARTKRELVAITEEWAERLDGSGVVVHSMHPGWADTKGVRNWMPVFRAVTRPIIRDADEGADTIVWMGGAPDPLRSTGKLWHDRRVRPTTYLIGAGADPAEAREELWARCEELAARAAEPGATSSSSAS